MSLIQLLAKILIFRYMKRIANNFLSFSERKINKHFFNFKISIIRTDKIKSYLFVLLYF